MHTALWSHHSGISTICLPFMWENEISFEVLYKQLSMIRSQGFPSTVKESPQLWSEGHQAPAHHSPILDTMRKKKAGHPLPRTHLDWVCLVMFRMVAPSFPIMAPTNWVGTSRRRGRSQGFGLDTDPGDACLDEPRCPGPRRPRSCSEGFCWAAVSSGM